MSIIAKKLCNTQYIQLYRVLATSQVRRCHFFPDYKPGPFPKTEKEREEAARKYNLLKEEYEAYPDDGTGSGDYPKIPIESVDSRDPYYNWDDGELRRDYLEPVPREYMLYLPEYLSTAKEDVPRLYGIRIFFSFVAVFLGLFYVFMSFEFVQPTLEKQYPQEGVTHYTFDPDLNKKK